MVADSSRVVSIVRGAEPSPCGRHALIWVSLIALAVISVASSAGVGIYVDNVRKNVETLVQEDKRYQDEVRQQMVLLSQATRNLVASTEMLKNEVTTLKTGVTSERQERIELERRLVK